MCAFTAQVGSFRRIWCLRPEILVRCSPEHPQLLLRHHALGPPWGAHDFQPRWHIDGSLHGFTTATLAGLHVCVHDEKLMQSHEVVQGRLAHVDGEPCKLPPSCIRIAQLHLATREQRAKQQSATPCRATSSQCPSSYRSR